MTTAQGGPADDVHPGGSRAGTPADDVVGVIREKIATGGLPRASTSASPSRRALEVSRGPVRHALAILDSASAHLAETDRLLEAMKVTSGSVAPQEAVRLDLAFPTT